MKKQINFRASTLTSEQIEWLMQKWGTSQTETLTVVVDRIFRQENRQKGKSAMFDCFTYSDKSAPLTREDATELLKAGYGFEFFPLRSGTYHGWYISPAAGVNGGFDVEFVDGEKLHEATYYATTDAVIDEMLKHAPLDMWAVLEETGEPLNVPTYGNACW